MSKLALTLVIKIAVTLIFIVAPLFLAPPSFLDGFLHAGDSAGLYRLYGVALLALVVGYAVALRSVQAGELPRGTLYVGITSNGGAALVLMTVTLGWWQWPAAAFFALIALSFAASLIWPEAMMRVRPSSQGETSHG